MENLDKTIEEIHKYLGVSEVEKKSKGEVFTPFKLINEMLDTLPIEVWNNPNLKWLDPANGIGNFPVIVVQRLMEGLKDIFTDKELRYETKKILDEFNKPVIKYEIENIINKINDYIENKIDNKYFLKKH